MRVPHHGVVVIGVDSVPCDVDHLRHRMLDELRDKFEVVPGENVTQALLTVPRHVFVPEVSTKEAYHPGTALVTKRDTDGTSLSSVSAAYIQASMLDMAGLRPGMRVLEIGSGGYNAALIAEIVGPAGRVVTIDIDDDVVRRAERLLGDAGYGSVRVMQGDAEHGAPGEAPFDRIIVTVSAWDLPPAWWEQLTDGGRIVLPLLVRSTTRTVALDKRDGRWVHHRHERSGFVAMQGIGAHSESFLTLAADDQVGLRVDGDPGVDAAPLARALRTSPIKVWSGVEFVGNEPFDDMDLFVATRSDRFGLLMALPPAVESKLVSTWARWGAPTIYSPTGFAYRVSRRVPGSTDRFEFGARAHGPDARELADRLVRLLRTWDREHRRAGEGPEFTVAPAGLPDSELPAGCVTVRRHTRVVVGWPTGADRADPHTAEPSG